MRLRLADLDHVPARAHQMAANPAELLWRQGLDPEEEAALRDVILEMTSLIGAYPLAQRVGQGVSAVPQGIRQRARQEPLAADHTGPGVRELEARNLVDGAASLGGSFAPRMQDRTIAAAFVRVHFCEGVRNGMESPDVAVSVGVTIEEFEWENGVQVVHRATLNHVAMTRPYADRPRCAGTRVALWTN